MVTENELQNFCNQVKEIRDAFYASRFPNNARDNITYEIGRRYARIVVVNGRDSGRSVYCFVDMDNGNILKAASWKAPAPNGIRGNIANGAESCCDWNGTKYLR